jgi:hypothetical protein
MLMPRSSLASRMFRRFDRSLYHHLLYVSMFVAHRFIISFFLSVFSFVLVHLSPCVEFSALLLGLYEYIVSHRILTHRSVVYLNILQDVLL